MALGNLPEGRKIKALAADLDTIGDDVREKGAIPPNQIHISALIEVYNKLGKMIGAR